MQLPGVGSRRRPPCAGGYRALAYRPATPARSLAERGRGGRRGVGASVAARLVTSKPRASRAGEWAACWLAVMAGRAADSEELLHNFLQGLERHGLDDGPLGLGLDHDGFAGRRVATFARFGGGLFHALDLQQPRQRHDARTTLADLLVNERGQRVEEGGYVLARQAALRGQVMEHRA